MTIKTYDLYKTVKKTMKENNLFLCNYGNNVLLDADILADINLNSDHRNAIIKNIQKLHIFHDTMGVFILRFDKWTAFEIRATFANHFIYNEKTGKRLYVISEITNCKVTTMRRESIYQARYDDITEQIRKTDHAAPLNDIEI